MTRALWRVMFGGLVLCFLMPRAGRADSPSDSRRWAPPSAREALLLGAAETLIAVDVLQTLDMKRHPNKALFEANPFLGSHPSDARVIAMASLGALATSAAWYALPARCRWVVPVFLAIGEGIAIAGNAQAGMAIRF